MKKLFVVGAVGCAIASCLVGCGGGGGGSAPPPVTNQAVGGIWRVDTTLNGQHVTGVGLVAEDGRVVSFSQNLTNGCADVGIGSISATGSTISGTAKVDFVSFAFTPGITVGCTFSDGATSASETISGSVVQRSSLTLTGTVTTSLGTVYPSSTVTSTFDPLYNTASSLAAISGNWTGPTNVVMNINSSGAIFAQDPTSGCVVNGQVSLINSSYNAYAVSATYSNCAGSASVLNGVTASGLAAVDASVSPNVLYVGYSATVAGATIIVAATATR